ncbi:MAG: ATP-dependent RNA helicase [Xanthomonadales bacterium PRO7]|nr:ATP-dependent RNA helicase [Xanthomonadales bacterium PRO7]
MSDAATTPESIAFRDLGLGDAVLAALAQVGYETPSPIQAATIPPLLAGRDVLGQAQTGTGKTAAFALPILARLDLSKSKPQALVLAPTRELAIQVAEAFQRYAAQMPGFHVLPIYGGQSYGPQLSGLKRGTHVVVGTPGRVIDHLERGSLDLSQLTTLVLDEADEMLRMGFIDDVEAVLKKTPPTRQIALFSATMPSQIKRIAQTYLRNPTEIAIKAKTTTAANIRQRYWFVSGLHKLDALTRILEAEPFEAMLVFMRTKQATEEIAQKLQARGFAAAAINGDIIQAQRERTIAQLKDGQIDILVATDVAARGLDVERISHVLNYDIPTDTEAYVHRIGRTGRAGRSGEAILFVAPREQRLLQAIERATRQPITQMQLPSVEAVNDRRVAKFTQRITDTLASDDLTAFRQLIEQYERERNVPAVEIAAALARLVQGKQPLLLQAAQRESRPLEKSRFEKPAKHEHQAARDRGTARGDEHPRPSRAEHDSPFRPRRDDRPRQAEAGFETYRINVGNDHGVRPGNIVGAIANEAGLDAKHIGRIDIRDRYTLLDLPEGMPAETFLLLKTVRVAGQRLLISRMGDSTGSSDTFDKPPRKPPFKSAPSERAAHKPKSFKPDGFDKPKRGPHKHPKAR